MQSYLCRWWVPRNSRCPNVIRPGRSFVNMTGKRLMNESMPYVEACHHTYGGEFGQGRGPGENIPAWLIFDQRLLVQLDGRVAG